MGLFTSLSQKFVYSSLFKVLINSDLRNQKHEMEELHLLTIWALVVSASNSYLRTSTKHKSMHQFKSKNHLTVFVKLFHSDRDTIIQKVSVGSFSNRQKLPI